MKIFFNLYAASSPRAAGMQQSVRMCYFLARAGARVELHICTQFFSTREELFDFFGFEDLRELAVHFYSSPFSSRRFLPVLSKPRGVKLDWLLNYAWGAWFHLRRIVGLACRRQREPRDIILLRGQRFPALYILLQRLLGLTSIYEVHEISYLNDIPEPALLSKRVLFDFERFSYRHAKGVVFISRTLKDLVERKWGSVERAIVLPSGAMPFDAAPLPVDGDLTRVYFVGNYYYFSGLDYVVRALAELDAVSLTIVGGGGPGDSDYDRLSTLARKLGVEERVDFRGFVEPRELANVYAEAQILVMPHAGHIRSKYFVSPLKLFEYLNARRPIIASDLPTIREVLEDGQNAVLVEANDTDALVQGLQRFISDESFAREVAERAYETSKRYSIAARGTELCGFLRTVLRSRARATT